MACMSETDNEVMERNIAAILTRTGTRPKVTRFFALANDKRIVLSNQSKETKNDHEPTIWGKKERCLTKQRETKSRSEKRYGLMSRHHCYFLCAPYYVC